ncbi:hypothetical protein THASP1DRAFT_19512 [Thamnocephalis sphaerospora]|uniref:OTU domain-containing protein n=1 Tax=Thamnocephalis sphaerospora TaxID=78915 RepID=A0A4P9XJW2_9FUNG|nr:hypothetical protein THASP1DRAFT_19512 [Thamnocephalis sphaerospora]|eukprot:RKP05671.1 hypothetical protein THASP1DRAFT_19512 [Thamnocephalis sphaerospora]
MLDTNAAVPSDESLEALEARQRQEHRELAAQITALRKAVPKGDKRRKKEAQTEAAQMEADQEARHAAERQAFEARQGQEKKAAEMRRMQEEAEEEAANQVDMQKVEMNAITDLLRAMQLSLEEVTADGHCLYNAVADQLRTQHKIQARKGTTHLELRKQVAAYMRDHRDDFIPFLTNAHGDILNEFADYCHRLETTAEWGGHAEILAMSRIFRLPVHIVQMGAPVMKISEEFPSDRPLRISYHRHAYGLGEHYNSLRPAKR